MNRMRPDRTGGSVVRTDERHGRLMGIRFSILAMVAVLILSACGTGSETAAGTDAETGGDSESSTDVPVVPGGGSDWCQSVFEVGEEATARVDEDDSTQIEDLYTFTLGIFRRLAADAPNELESDFALVSDSLEKYADWSKDPLQPNPLDSAEQAAFEAANERINVYLEDECGIDMGAGDEAIAVDTAEFETGESDPGSEDGSSGTLTVTVGGTTYEETLGGAYGVSCDLYGDQETGSIGVYLDGADFQASVSSYDTGVEPGTYEGSIWVFATDLAIDELTWDLQEVDGEFKLTEAEELSDSEWLFAGSFSVSVEDPPASVEATFSCVGFGY